MSRAEYSFLIANTNGSWYRFEVETRERHPRVVICRYVPDEQEVLERKNIIYFEVPSPRVLRSMGQALIAVAEASE